MEKHSVPSAVSQTTQDFSAHEKNVAQAVGLGNHGSQAVGLG